MRSAGAKGLRAVVIKGNGKHFQAGADLKWIDAVRTSSRRRISRVSRATAEAVQRLNLAPVPTIALVHGACFGGGTGLVAACDVVIAADNATFSIAEVRWGLTAAIIIPQLNDAIGVRQMRRYALTGERFDADEARRIGLVHQVVPAGRAGGSRRAMVGHVLENGPEAIAQTKALTLERAFGDLRRGRFSRSGRASRRKAAIARGSRGPRLVRREAVGQVELRKCRSAGPTDHQPDPPPPPPPPPDEPPPEEPPRCRHPRRSSRAASRPTRWSATGRSPSRSAKDVISPVGAMASPVYQDDTAAPTPAAASTPVNRSAQVFSTSSAMA